MKYVYLVASLLIFASCSETEEKKKPTDKKVVPGKVTEVETVYEEGQFKNPDYTALLQELDLCTEEVLCLQCATCTPEFFRFFPIAKNENVKNLFALQIKALTKLKNEPPLPTREVRVYTRENGKLVRCNRMRAYVIELITNESGVEDLMLRFRRVIEDEEHFFHCLFSWSASDRKYMFTSVERIEGRNWGGPVKKEDKAATSQQVYDELVAEGFIL